MKQAVALMKHTSCTDDAHCLPFEAHCLHRYSILVTLIKHTGCTAKKHVGYINASSRLRWLKENYTD